MQQEAIVFIELQGQTVPVGKLRISEDGRYSGSQFAYGRKYLERRDAVSIDPVQMPLSEDMIRTPENFTLFNGIRDAAPDAWGRSLIDRLLLRAQGRPAGEADYLFASQSGSRIGALRFGPTPKGPGQVLDYAIPDFTPVIGDLHDFQALVDHMDDAPLPPHLADYLAPGSDVGGARPKGTVAIDGELWLAKFDRANDRLAMAPSEAACLDLCEMAGVAVAERRVEKIGDRDVLLVKRFDRERMQDGTIRRRHMLSSLTLLGAHEYDRAASGYADLFGATRRYGHHDAGEEIYRRMVMNVLCGNTDDHYRNHAFLLNDQGQFRLSPLYDVTPTIQAGLSRSLFMHLGRAGDGREATLENAVAAGPTLGLSPDQAVAIANDLSGMVAARWEETFRSRGSSTADIELVRNSFAQAGRRVEAPRSSYEP